MLLHLGVLKWMVEQPSSSVAGRLSAASQRVVSETGRVVVEEIGKLLTKYSGAGGRVWLIGTATCETYMRCQVYYSNMENNYDLQAVPIAAKAPQAGLFPRSVVSLNNVYILEACYTSLIIVGLCLQCYLLAASHYNQATMKNNVQKLKSQDLQKKWNDTCLRLHPTFHNDLSSGSSIAPIPLTITGLYNSKLLGGKTNPQFTWKTSLSIPM
ncbi:hypothetical protein QQ045_030301 [Rhodiola kirilowii]